MTQLRFTNAQQVLDAFPSLKYSVTVKPLDVEPISYVRAVLKSELPEQALVFCAYLMAKRDAVRWLCQVLRLPHQLLSPNEIELVKLAEDWVRSPTETSRSLTLVAGMAEKKRSAAAWAAIAAGWSGGNLSSDDKHPVPPPALLTAQGVSVAFNLLIAAPSKLLPIKRIEEYANIAIGLLKQK